jgi:hypothetical protein
LLLDTIHRWLVQVQVPHLRLGNLRLRLIKIGGWVRRRLDCITLHLASSNAGEPLWRLLATIHVFLAAALERIASICRQSMRSWSSGRASYHAQLRA